MDLQHSLYLSLVLHSDRLKFIHLLLLSSHLYRCRSLARLPSICPLRYGFLVLCFSDVMVLRCYGFLMLWLSGCYGAVFYCHRNIFICVIFFEILPLTLFSFPTFQHLCVWLFLFAWDKTYSSVCPYLPHLGMNGYLYRQRLTAFGIAGGVGHDSQRQMARDLANLLCKFWKTYSFQR